MALSATRGFEEGCIIFLYDGANAFNSINRHKFLPALEKLVLSLVPTHGNPQNSCLY